MKKINILHIVTIIMFLTTLYLIIFNFHFDNKLNKFKELNARESTQLNQISDNWNALNNEQKIETINQIIKKLDDKDELYTIFKDVYLKRMNNGELILSIYIQRMAIALEKYIEYQSEQKLYFTFFIISFICLIISLTFIIKYNVQSKSKN